LILVIVPPVLIMTAFFVLPAQTAGFFNFQVNKSQALSENPNSKVLGTSTVSQGSVLAAYTAGVLEPQAAAAVKALRVVAPATVANICLPGECGTPATQTVITNPTTVVPGAAVPGAAGATGATGLTGSIGATGAIGATGSAGSTTIGVTSLNALNGVLNVAGGGINTVSTNGVDTITVTGTLPTVGTAGTYGSPSTIPVFTTDDQGRVTGVTPITISGLGTGSFTSANISQWTNDSGYLTAPVANTSLSNSGLTVSAGTGLSGGGLVSLGGTTTLSLPNVGISGTYGSATQVPVLTTDAQGRITGVVNTPITGFLTAESDTLASVTGRGASTSMALTLDGGVTTTTTNALRLDSGTTGGILIGTGANAKTITIGNTTGASVLTLDSGTGAIYIGTGAQARSINIGTGAATQIVAIGSTSGASSLTIDSGTGWMHIGTSVAKAIVVGNTSGASSLILDAGTAGIMLNGVAASANNKDVLCIDPTTHQLFFGSSQANCNPSSEEYKHNIADISLGLDAVNALRPVSFNFDSDNEPSLGFIAEEAQKVDERLVVRDANGVIQAIDPSQFIPILTKALQQLSGYVGPVSSNDLSGFVLGVQTEVPPDPVAVIKAKITGGTQFLTDFIAARVTAIRGYFDEIFANKVHTNNICLTKSDGSEVCMNGDQLEKLLPSATPNPSVSPTATPVVPTITPVESPSPSSTGILTPTPVASESASPTALPI
jgi:hypothetical protein